MHLGLSALGVGLGDEVIVPESTWIASVSPIVHLGAKPVFVDILKDSWCIDPSLVEAAITPKTKAIICVHLYGNLCELNQLIKISKKYNIPLLRILRRLMDHIILVNMLGHLEHLAYFLLWQ